MSSPEKPRLPRLWPTITLAAIGAGAAALVGFDACLSHAPSAHVQSPASSDPLDPDGVIATQVVQDFEGSIDFGKWPEDHASSPTLSTDWAASGERSLRIDGGLMASFHDLSSTDFSGKSILRLHIKNTSDVSVAMELELQDGERDRHSRHRHDFGAEPGVTTVDFDIAGDLWRGYEDHPYRGEVKTPLDKSQIRGMAIKNKGSAPVYVDQIEVLTTRKIAAEGGFAFDFGKTQTRVMRQMTAVFETSLYSDKTGFGLLEAPPSVEPQSNSLPTPMLGDGLALGKSGFRVDLKGGDYEGLIAFERGGFWEYGAASYERATLLVNGEKAHEHVYSKAGQHFFLEDVEVTDMGQASEKLVWPAHAVSRFKFTAKDGQNVFQLSVTGESGAPLRVAGLVLAPGTEAGRAFLSAHESLQKKAIGEAFPAKDISQRGEGRAEPKDALVVRAMHPGEQMAPLDWPEAKAPPHNNLLALRGQPVALQIGVYGKDALDLHMSATPLEGPEGATLDAPRLSYGRYAPMRPLNRGPAWVQIDHFRPEADFSVASDLARAVLAEAVVPEDAAPGVYEGAITIEGGGERATVAMKIDVVAAKLGRIPIPVCFLRNATPFGPEVVGEDAYWALQEALLREQGAAGLTCVTGGQGVFYGVEDEGDHYVIDGPRAKRYLALAKKYGVDEAVISYGGFLPALKQGFLPLRNRKQADPGKYVGALSNLEKSERLPPHYFYAYDEPSSEGERRKAAAITLEVTQAGGRTLGYTSVFWGEDAWESLIDATYAPCLLRHEAKDIETLVKMGKHPFLYGATHDRFTFGMHTWQSMQLGAEGRVEWVGLLTHGLAFNNLDGRTASDVAWVVHDRLGVMETPIWVASREGLTDLRVRLALERDVPKGDTSLNLWSLEGYTFQGGAWTDETLDRSRATMIERLRQIAAGG